MSSNSELITAMTVVIHSYLEYRLLLKKILCVTKTSLLLLQWIQSKFVSVARAENKTYHILNWGLCYSRKSNLTRENEGVLTVLCLNSVQSIPDFTLGHSRWPTLRSDLCIIKIFCMMHNVKTLEGHFVNHGMDVCVSACDENVSSSMARFVWKPK